MGATDSVARTRLDVYPDLSYYFGLSPEEIAHMPQHLKGVYLDAIPRLRSQDLQALITGANFRHLDKQAQKAVSQSIDEHTARGKPAEKKEQPPAPEYASFDEYRRAMEKIGIAVKTQDDA